MLRRRIVMSTLAHLPSSIPRRSTSSNHSHNGLHLTIGDITVSVPNSVTHPERVSWLLPGNSHNNPRSTNDNTMSLTSHAIDELPPLDGGNAFFQLDDPTTRGYLRWICQKERLRQDMCLVGEPGPAMRWLVLMYSHLVRREVQCLALNRDTTESDLGQRREIRNGTLVYDDQCVVVAAREGQLLLLEGLERVERNVLPVINNLLENREMHLENGMMLIHPERYDRLLHEYLAERNARKRTRTETNTEDGDRTLLTEAHEEMRRMGFIRVSEHFRVVGITVPVPPYDGNPLDPPLRSRFQCLYVHVPLPEIATMTPNTARAAGGGRAAATSIHGARSDATEALLKLRTAIDEVNTSTKDFNSGAGNAESEGGNEPQQGGATRGAATRNMGRGGRELQTVGSYELAMLARQLQLFKDIPVGDLLPRAFPWPLFALQTGSGGGGAHVEEATRRRRDYERILDACGIGVPSFDYVTDGAIRTTTPSMTKPSQPETFNYVLRLHNVRLLDNFKGETAAHCCVVAEAQVASGDGVYELPIRLGAAALAAASGNIGGEIALDKEPAAPRVILTPAHRHVLQAMVQLHISGQHVLLLGPTGCGKTTILHEFAHMLGYKTETMYLYADMTNKDLFQRRTTDSATGNTSWSNSALIEAALAGHVAVLDGIDKLPDGMLASLQQLLVDGGANLYDGTVLKPLKEYELLRAKLGATDAEMRTRRILPVHPAFRVIATARPSTHGAGAKGTASGDRGRWRLSRDVTSLFGVVTMPEATHETLRAVMVQVAEGEMSRMDVPTAKSTPIADVIRDVDRLLKLRDTLDELRRSEPKITQLSLRQLLHLIRFRVRYPDDFTPGVESALLLPLMAALTAAEVRRAMRECGFNTRERSTSANPTEVASEEMREGRRSKRHDLLTEIPSSSSTSATATTCTTTATKNGTSKTKTKTVSKTNDTVPGNDNSNNDNVASGSDSTRVFALHGMPLLRIARVYTEREQALVPYVPYFHSNPVHESIIAWLAKQYAVGNNILLIGNQGVGKNKVVDAFLARIRVPRQYIQLHRDTTVGTLTINPTVAGGRVVWEDSPLVKAVQQGHCLVVDEIDKAPVEVVQVLKGLIEDHEMRLRDGRQIRGPKARVIKKSDIDATVEEGIIAMHPDFRIIVLANPPGYPFHGNDFYRECGDLFASYVMGNPDAISQLRVLRAYGPSIPDALLGRLISAFQQLQRSFEEGHITYPFSLRELIAVVKHMAAFPQDGIYDALNNVFNFDARDDNTLQLVRRVLQLHLSPILRGGGMRRLLPLRAGQPLPLQSLPQPLQVPSGVKGTVVLPSRLVLDGKPYPPTPQSVLTWQERYREADFAADTEAEKSEMASFTEWSAAIRFPFLRPGDTVMAITTADDTEEMSDVVTESATPQRVAVLLKRSSNHNGNAVQQLLLVTVALPSVAALAAMPRAGLQPGTVQFFDLTTQLPTALDSNANDNAHTGDKKAKKSASTSSSGTKILSLHTLQMYSRETWAHGPCLTVVDAAAGVALLVRQDASVRSIAPEDEESEARFNVKGNKTDGKEVAMDAVLHVEIAPPAARDDALFSIRPESGLVAMVRGAEVFAWLNDHRVAVTLPVDVEGLYFFASNMASVKLRTAPHFGVLKIGIVAHSGEVPTVSASFCPLPNGVDGTVVDIHPTRVTHSTNQDDKAEEEERQGSNTSRKSSSGEVKKVERMLLQPLHPAELKGAVLIPADAANGDVVYMTLDEYSSSDRTWSLRVFTDSATASALQAARGSHTFVQQGSSGNGSGLRIDHTRHQLIATTSAVTQASSASVSQTGVVAVDTRQHTSRRFGPSPVRPSSRDTASHVSTSPIFALDASAGAALHYDAATQRLDVADVVAERVEGRYRDWSTLLDGSVQTVGNAVPPREVPMGYSKPRKQPSGTVKHGKEDDEEHHGGNTYAGGTGGTDTAGLGGLVGPYRLDKGNPIHQVDPAEKQKVPKHIIEEARRMGREALAERLREIGMDQREYEQYRAMQDRVRGPLALLRSVLSGLKAAEGERTWLRGQTDGVWDDSKIVEGIVGERNIYKRRADSTETNPFQSKYKKRLLFVLDVSASMYRFESMDHRLSKLVESTVMVMEAFTGFEDKIDYSLVGHNGDEACIPLVPFGQPPTNQKARMEICQRMIAYAQYCWSGDNTVEAMRQSVDLVTAEKGDAYLVFVISDANLQRYGIHPRVLRRIMLSHKEVQMFCIFIATLGAQASNLQAELPAGHGFECMQTDALPHILKQIFMAVNLL